VNAPIAGLVVALPQESRSLTGSALKHGECLALDERTLVHVCGVGTANVAWAVRALIDRGAQGVVSWGCTAGLSAGLAPGDLCLPRAILDADGANYEVSPCWHRRAASVLGTSFALHTGPILTVGRIVASPAEKSVLAARFGAVAADMESAGIAAAALEHSVPFLAVRAVVDPAGLAVPLGVSRALDARGGVDVSQLLAWVVRHPGDWPGLIALRWHFRAALRTLRAASHRLGSGFLVEPLAGA
jgi:adenosylhomocysteine nucleosidase